MSERLQTEIFDLKVKVAVLEKMVEKFSESVAQAHVAEKTADKAMEFAQEAIALVKSYMDQQQNTGYNPNVVAPEDPFFDGVDFSQVEADRQNGLSPVAAQMFSDRVQSDKELSDQFNQGLESVGDEPI